MCSFFLRIRLVDKGMNNALVKLFQFTEFLPVKQSWGYQSLSLLLHPNQYLKVVNLLRGNHYRSSAVIMTQNWLKTIVKNQIKQFESHFQFCFVNKNWFSHDHHKWTFPPLHWFQFMNSCCLWANRYMKLTISYIKTIFWFKKSFESILKLFLVKFCQIFYTCC